MGAIVILCCNRDRMCQVLAATTCHTGALAWTPISGEKLVVEADALEMVDRQKRYDPDIWVVEIETVFGHEVFGERLLHLRID